jgi:hypothetical protein
MQNNNMKNASKFDFERSILYTRKRPDEINLNMNNTNNVKKPLPIQFKTYSNHNLANIDSRFTMNPINGTNPFTNERPLISYQNKKEHRSEIENRITDYQNLPQTQSFPINSNKDIFVHIPENTRLSNQTYSHMH